MCHPLPCSQWSSEISGIHCCLQEVSKKCPQQQEVSSAYPWRKRSAINHMPTSVLQILSYAVSIRVGTASRTNGTATATAFISLLSFDVSHPIALNQQWPRPHSVDPPVWSIEAASCQDPNNASKPSSGISAPRPANTRRFKTRILFLLCEHLVLSSMDPSAAFRRLSLGLPPSRRPLSVLRFRWRRSHMFTWEM